MKKQIIFTCILLINFVTYSQINYEKGYFISNDNTKTECLIKNEDWSNNPTSFTYKINNSSDLKTNQISTVKAFGIYDISNFERHQVKIDVSNNNLQALSLQRSPEWEEKTLFLKIIATGDAILYRYRKNSQNVYFYSKKDRKIEQLIYKKYELKSKEIATNLTYLNQLLKNVNCNNISLEKIKNLEYNNKYLINYFNQHNICVSPNSKNNQVSKSYKSEFKFKLNSGLTISSINYFGNPNYSDEYTIDFGSNQTFRIGFEAEVILPFNKRKWSLFIEPAYTYFKSSVENEFKYGGGTNPKTGTVKANADFNLLEISLGGRNYFYSPNKHIKMFADFGFIWNTFFNSNVNYEIVPEINEKLEFDKFFVAINFFGGVGILIKDKINVAAKFQSTKKIVIQSTNFKSDLNSFTFILGYTFN